MILAILIINSLSLVILFFVVISPIIRRFIQNRQRKRVEKLRKQLRSDGQNKLLEGWQSFVAYVDFLYGNFPNNKVRKQFSYDFSDKKRRNEVLMKVYRNLEKQLETIVHEKEEKNDKKNSEKSSQNSNQK